MKLPSHLDSQCTGKYPLCQGCAESVKQAPSGRWYITIGHAGFNSPANNRQGYATKESAEKATARYERKGHEAKVGAQ